MKVKANKYGAGKYRIIVNDDGERITTGCCCCYLDIRSVTATLPWYGYNEFECEGLEQTGKKYLGFQASGKGKIAWCGDFFYGQPTGLWTDIEQSWEIDPFTGDVCYTGEKASRILRPCNTLESCTENLKIYNCGTIPVNSNCPEQTLEWQETLSNSYDLSGLEQKVDEMFSRLKGSVWDDVPAGSHATIINGSNDSILAVGGCALNVASHKFDEEYQEISKTKLFVEFTRNTTYRLREKSGSTETMSEPIFAAKGEQLIIDPPENDGDEIEIYIEQKERKIIRPIYVTQDHKGNKTTRNLQIESGELFESPLCEFFNKMEITDELTESEKIDFTYTSSNTIGSSYSNTDNFEYNRRDKEKTIHIVGSAPTTTREKDVTAQCVESTYNDTYREYDPPPNGVGIVHYDTSQYNRTTSILGYEIMPDGSDGNAIWEYSWTSSYEKHWPTPQSSSGSDNQSGVGGSVDVCYSSGLRTWPYRATLGLSLTWSCPNQSRSGSDGFGTSYSGNQSIEFAATENTAHVIKIYSGSSNYSGSSDNGYTTTSTSRSTTYSLNETLSVIYEMVGEWEQTTEPNEDFVVLKYKDPILEKEQNVNVDLELSFVAENSSEPITYEHWLHYYKKIDTNPTGNCVFVEVEAQNIKWTTTSTGGAESETRNITLAAPTEIAVGRIENLYYQVTKVVDEA